MLWCAWPSARNKNVRTDCVTHSVRVKNERSKTKKKHGKKHISTCTLYVTWSIVCLLPHAGCVCVCTRFTYNNDDAGWSSISSSIIALNLCVTRQQWQPNRQTWADWWRCVQEITSMFDTKMGDACVFVRCLYLMIEFYAFIVHWRLIGIAGIIKWTSNIL